MRCIIGVVAFSTAAIAFAQEATLDLSPENLPAPDPTITDCVIDHQKRGQSTEEPIDPADVSTVRIMLRIDLRGGPLELEELQKFEPLCFYRVPDGRILVRDARGLEYYFHQVPKWQLERIDVKTRRE